MYQTPVAPLLILSFSLTSARPRVFDSCLGLDWNLAHGARVLLVLEVLESTLEDLEGNDDGRAGPQEPAKGGEDGVSAGSGTYGATAEEEFADEDGEGDKAGEVKECVECLQCEMGIWVGCSWHKSWGDFKVGNRDEGEKRSED